MEVESDILVRAVMAKTAAKGNADLARALGLDKVGADKRVGRWLNGSNEPDFDGTIRLLRAGGWLNEKKLTEALARATAARARDEAARTSARASRLPGRGSVRRRPAHEQGS